jgi:hypothetical protein
VQLPALGRLLLSVVGHAQVGNDRLLHFRSTCAAPDVVRVLP